MALPKILIAAGGSGGHLFPAQQLAAELEGSAEVLIGGHGLETNPFFDRRFPFQEIVAGRPQRGEIGSFLWKSAVGSWQALQVMRNFCPDVVVGFGSYHTFPLLGAATLLRKRIVLFEANAMLGKVNRLFARDARLVASQFPLPSVQRNGITPLLPWGRSETRASRQEALSYFGLETGVLTLLVFGGSQGASFFNELMPKVAEILPPCQVIHCSGKGSALYTNVRACVKPFEPRMDLAYAAADIVICRSGGSTIAELIRHHKKALLIPFPLASENHQWENGRFFVREVGGGRLLAQREATVARVREEILSLLTDEEGRRWSEAGRQSLAEQVLATIS